MKSLRAFLCVLCVFVVNVPSIMAKEKGSVAKAAFGKLADGTAVEIYTLTNANGATAKIMTYGATLTELHVPDRAGKLADVTLGCPRSTKQSTASGWRHRARRSRASASAATCPAPWPSST